MNLQLGRRRTVGVDTRLCRADSERSCRPLRSPVRLVVEAVQLIVLIADLTKPACSRQD